MRPQRKANRLEKYDYSQSGAYFVTICTQGRRWNLSKTVVGTPVPGCPPEPRVELLPHGIVAERYIRQMDAFYDDLTVDQFVIMPDHIHLLLSVHDTDGHPRTGVPRLSNIIRTRFRAARPPRTCVTAFPRATARLQSGALSQNGLAAQKSSTCAGWMMRSVGLE